MEHQDATLYLALSGMEFLRPKERIRVALEVRETAVLARLRRDELEQMLGRRLRTGLFDPCRSLEDAHSVYRSLILNDIMCTFYADPRFPRMLREIYDPPLVLYYRGTLPRDGEPSIAVVGTRRPADRARRAARELGRELSQAGVSVVSGLAHGIDAEAHRGALEAGGAHVAVLGAGLARIHPESNRALGRRILRGGGSLVSEYAPEVPPAKHHYPARNRLISGLAKVVVIVQAPEKSGALITSEFALEQNREVVVHEAGLCGVAGAGGRALAETGAPVVRCGADVLGVLGMEGAPSASGHGERDVGAEIARELESLLEEMGTQE